MNPFLRSLPILACAAALGACTATGGGLFGASSSETPASYGPTVVAWRLSDSPGTLYSRTPGRPLSLASIQGQDEDGLRRLFGRPQLVRDEGQAQVWKFRSDGCTLHVFMYRNGAGYAARHVEALDPQLRPLSDVAACAGSVQAQRSA